MIIKPIAAIKVQLDVVTLSSFQPYHQTLIPIKTDRIADYTAFRFRESGNLYFTPEWEISGSEIAWKMCQVQHDHERRVALFLSHEGQDLVISIYRCIVAGAQ